MRKVHDCVRSAVYATLQWGRNLIVAERRAERRAELAEVRASMGPQLDSCGKHLLGYVLGCLGRASMGPQLDSCGKAIRPHKSFICAFASMGPQLDSCGKFGQFANVQRVQDASMGPQLDSCGKLILLMLGIQIKQLQWGRNLIVAESTTASARWSGPSRFNGAAT